MKSLLLVSILLMSCSVTRAGQDQPRQGGRQIVKTDLDGLVNLLPAERIERLSAFLSENPQSSLSMRARELLVSARASLGDDKLKNGDLAGGVEQFRLAINDAPANMSDKLFLEVIVQLPMNLFLRGHGSAALEAARLIEAKAQNNPSRLLAIVTFYLRTEQAGDAVRLSEVVTQLAPEMSAAHQALGAAYHIAFRLDDAAISYARALELDPASGSARRSLADLRRAGRKSEEALALYREQLGLNPGDKLARAGVVLSLFDSGKREAAESELQAALGESQQNLPLLVGAAYWYVAHGESARALQLAEQATTLEPRYTWAQIALARALVAEKRPVDAEHALRIARKHGRFPTLDYELASALAAMGLYDEAAEELTRSFTLEGDQIVTRLAGRTPARAVSFRELLAPERQAGLFQPVAADTESNARMLKGLLAFHISENQSGEEAEVNVVAKQATTAGVEMVTAGREFITVGEGDMRLFRELYVVNKLLRRGVALPTVIELMEAATGGVEAALDAPAASVAVLAEELRETRARHIANNSRFSLPAVPRNILSNIVRGRIEDSKGWALFNQGEVAEAVVRLRRATSVLPEGSVWWRTALWHLGAATEATGNTAEALAAYLRSYNPQSPDPARRAVIEALYARVHGSLDGLEAKIGPSPSRSSNSEPQPPSINPAIPANTIESNNSSNTTSPTIPVAPISPSTGEAVTDSTVSERVAEAGEQEEKKDLSTRTRKRRVRPR